MFSIPDQWLCAGLDVRKIEAPREDYDSPAVHRHGVGVTVSRHEKHSHNNIAVAQYKDHNTERRKGSVQCNSSTDLDSLLSSAPRSRGVAAVTSGNQYSSL